MDDIRVNFMILGAMKCGTTTLSHILKMHPDVSFSEPKEPNFFSSSKNWKNELKKYHGYFKKKRKLYGEASTSYTKQPSRLKSIWEDIYEYNSEMKLIYIVRNPIDRIISHYSHNYIKKRTNQPIEKMITRSNYIQVSSYFHQISPYIERFGRDQVLILDFDDLIENRNETIRNVMKFLNLNESSFKINQTQDVHANKSVPNPNPFSYAKKWLKGDRILQEKPIVPLETKMILYDRLRDDISNLELLINKDLSKWKNFN